MAPPPSSPAPPAASASRSPAPSPLATGAWSSTPAAPTRSRRPPRAGGAHRRDRAGRRRRRRAPPPRARHRRGRPHRRLVNNASILGPSPQPPLDAYPLDVLEDVLKVNALAPLRLIQLALPAMPAGARIVNVTSDAAVEAYEGWGGYGSSKAALEQLTRVLAVERPELARLRLRPGRHEHRACTSRPSPARTSPIARRPRTACPRCCRCWTGDLPSGRYRDAD